jgi:uncharacterized protein YciI
MALFVVSYIDKANSLPLRMATRPAHLAYAHDESNPAKVKIGGPYLDDKGEMCGSLIILEAPDKATAIKFTENDPYVKAGLFSSIDVRPYRLTVGSVG